MDDLLSDLTPEQAAAVTHGDGPLLILAAAGSGKTRVITRRVAYLLQCGVRAGSILAITFTNKAAREMRERVEKLAPGNRVWILTFHSLGARLLRMYADRLGFDKNFTIYDVDDRNKLVKEAILLADVDDTRFKADQVAGAISKAKNQLLTPSQFANSAHDFFAKTVAKVYPLYEKKLRAAHAMDFDDLLFLPAMALRHDEELRAELDNRFQHVLVDEYQDTNSAQYEIARRLNLHTQNLCVVGDPDQSIYKWRGSDIRNILDFERDYPNATTIGLGRNYRSTQAILHAAGTLIDHNKQRKKKPLVTENAAGEPVQVLTFDTGLDEADGIAERIQTGVKAGHSKYRDHAIFVRINALTRSLESAFLKRGIPFQIVKGLAFYERKENKDVLAYLRLLVNPADTVSFLRVVNEPARGVGKTSLDKLQAYAAAQEISLLTAAGDVAKITDIKGKAVLGLRDFYRLISDLRTQLELPPHEVIAAVLDKTGIRALWRDSKDDDDAERLANIEEVVTAARQFYEEDPDRTLGDFLENVALASDVDGWDAESDRVSVMTLHSAKGLEFPIVYVAAVEQGLLPHERSLQRDDELEEERRLCFVGMTRAMKKLHLCHARMREFRGQILYAIPSGFLAELPKEVERVDCTRGYNRNSLDVWRDRAGHGEPGAEIPMPAAIPEGEYGPGQIVQHEGYGMGKITDVSGYGALKKLKIRFAAAGEKTFVADKVKLKVVKR
jgi:DNA helicase-2/ATP-dependent DNA helicase PcrA